MSLNISLLYQFMIFHIFIFIPNTVFSCLLKSKTETTRDSLLNIFARFASATCVRFEFWLVLLIVWVHRNWPKWLWLVLVLWHSTENTLASLLAILFTIFSNENETLELYTNHTTVKIGKIKVTVVTKLIICWIHDGQEDIWTWRTS